MCTVAERVVFTVHEMLVVAVTPLTREPARALCCTAAALHYLHFVGLAPQDANFRRQLGNVALPLVALLLVAFPLGALLLVTLLLVARLLVSTRRLRGFLALV